MFAFCVCACMEWASLRLHSDAQAEARQVHKNTSAAHAGRSNFIRQAVIVLSLRSTVVWKTCFMDTYTEIQMASYLFVLWVVPPPAPFSQETSNYHLRKPRTLSFCMCSRRSSSVFPFTSLIYLSFKCQEILCKNNSGKLPFVFGSCRCVFRSSLRRRSMSSRWHLWHHHQF